MAWLGRKEGRAANGAARSLSTRVYRLHDFSHATRRHCSFYHQPLGFSRRRGCSLLYRDVLARSGDNCYTYRRSSCLQCRLPASWDGMEARAFQCPAFHSIVCLYCIARLSFRDSPRRGDVLLRTPYMCLLGAVTGRLRRIDISLPRQRRKRHDWKCPYISC